MCATCIGVSGESAVENVAPVTIGVATGAEYLTWKQSAVSFGQSLYPDQMQPLLCPSYHSLCRILDPLTGKCLSMLLFSLDL